MDKNFRIRTIITITMFAVALLGLYTFDSIPFKIIYAFFALMAAFELTSFFLYREIQNLTAYVYATLELAFLISSVIFVIKTDLWHFWYIILGVPGYDIFAYLFGRLCGGKVFGKSRPFPKISKNKTWEGTLLGLATAITLVAIMIATRGTFATDWFYLLCGPLALCGDLFESHLKRLVKVKDSNELVIKHKPFAAIEMLIGGSEGHGGFLDRVDSTAFTTTILLFISALL